MKTIGIRDRRVIEAFVRREAASGYKLDTDGERLDGAWLGGRGIASWRDGSIEFHDLGSRSAQTVQRAVRRAVPRSLLAEYRRK